jgi:hypothetical protein
VVVVVVVVVLAKAAAAAAATWYGCATCGGNDAVLYTVVARACG